MNDHSPASTDSLDLESRIHALEARNAVVDLNKAWETSLQRRSLIMILTYALLAGYMRLIGADKPLLNALIPTAGYFLSTLTMEWCKQAWISSRLKKS